MTLISRKCLSISVLIFGILTFGSLAHTDTTDPLVKARMEAMKELAANMKHLAKVSRGSLPFETEAIVGIFTSIQRNASNTPGLFSVYAMDPTSEAGTEIWENFEDFTKKAQSLESIAQELVLSVNTKDQLQSAMMALGSSCKSCHSKYRN
jgi:cytochrome c556